MIPVPTTELLVEEDGGVTIISYHQGICKAVKLNETGYRVRKLIVGNHSIQQIVSQVADSFTTPAKVSIQSVTKDVDEFIAELSQEGFITLESQKAEE